MSDRRLRELERATAEGDTEARASLIRGRVRAGKCPWCGEAGAIHAFQRTVDGEYKDGEGDYEAACCCHECFKEHGIPNGGMCHECPGAQR